MIRQGWKWRLYRLSQQYPLMIEQARDWLLRRTYAEGYEDGQESETEAAWNRGYSEGYASGLRAQIENIFGVTIPNVEAVTTCPVCGRDIELPGLGISRRAMAHQDAIAGVQNQQGISKHGSA